MNANLWAVFRNTDGGLDAALPFDVARETHDAAGHVAVRRGARGKLVVRDLATGLVLDRAEANPVLRRLEKLNPRLVNLV